MSYEKQIAREITRILKEVSNAETHVVDIIPAIATCDLSPEEVGCQLTALAHIFRDAAIKLELIADKME